MNEKQLLDAIGKMMDTRFAEQDKKLDTRLAGMATKEDISGLKGDISGLKEGQKNLSDRMTQVENSVTEIKVSYENHSRQIMNLLREDYSRVDTAVKKVSDYDEVKDKVSTHEYALQQHNKRITELEKKVI